MASETLPSVSARSMPAGGLRLAWNAGLRSTLLAWITIELPVRGDTPATWVTGLMGVVFASLSLLAWWHWLWGAPRALRRAEQVVSLASAGAWLYLTYAFFETGRHLVSDYGSLGVGLSAVLGVIAVGTSALFLPFVRLRRTRWLHQS